ncbi:MAG: transglycosylase SLT domain-containing protein [Synergistales bacterium]|nr:transglycosylase SLT domain-containing protein [Synergistales bacterium]
MLHRGPFAASMVVGVVIVALALPAFGEDGNGLLKDDDGRWNLEELIFRLRPLDSLVLDTLASTGASEEDLLAWKRRNVSPALRHLPFMERETQKKVAVIASYISSVNPALDAETIWLEAAAFAHYSQKYGVPMFLAVGVGNAESHFDPQAESGYGAAGVMQVVWRIHAGLLQANGILAPEDLHNPDLGIAAGCLILSRYLKDTSNTREALERYSGGANGYWGTVVRAVTQVIMLSMRLL